MAKQSNTLQKFLEYTQAYYPTLASLTAIPGCRKCRHIYRAVLHNGPAQDMLTPGRHQFHHDPAHPNIMWESWAVHSEQECTAPLNNKPRKSMHFGSNSQVAPQHPKLVTEVLLVILGNPLFTPPLNPSRSFFTVPGTARPQNEWTPWSNRVPLCGGLIEEGRYNSPAQLACHIPRRDTERSIAASDNPAKWTCHAGC